MSEHILDDAGSQELLEKLAVQERYIKELEMILDHSLIGFCVADEKGNILRVNKAQSRITGNDAENEVGSNLAEQEAAGIISSSGTMRVLQSRKAMSMEQSTFNGRKYFVQSNPVFDLDGNIQLVVSNLIDMNDIENLKREILSSAILHDGCGNDMDKVQHDHPEIIYKSARMKELIAISRKVALSNATVMILGETGVGKELLAEFIHRNSPRKDKPFIRINCGAIPENLLEAELFGYEAGSFTGGGKLGRKGLLEYANEGTLFLDEVGEMSLSLQVKLLRFLQKQEFFRIGGREYISLDVRVIAATNARLEQMVENGQFREDLYYRLNVLPIHIPSLSQRAEDIPVLVEHFLKQFNRKYGLDKCISPEVMTLLSTQDLKGNIRELQHLVERLVLISDTTMIDTQAYTTILQFFSRPIDNKSLLENDERALLEQLVKEYKTTKKISEILKISQPTAWRKLKKYGLI